ncbi:MAG: CarD family transcriptional regulator [Clostridiaceae bacterium]
MFQIGDMVCYPMHGVGVVESIEEQSVLGETAKYYMLRFVMGRMSAMVPVESAEAVGLRKLVCAGECEKVVAFLAEEGCSDESENWNQLYRDNLNKLRVGDIFGVADVVK